MAKVIKILGKVAQTLLILPAFIKGLVAIWKK